jgi:hypothetical protein
MRLFQWISEVQGKGYLKSRIPFLRTAISEILWELELTVPLFVQVSSKRFGDSRALEDAKSSKPRALLFVLTFLSTDHLLPFIEAPSGSNGGARPHLGAVAISQRKVD